MKPTDTASGYGMDPEKVSRVLFGGVRVPTAPELDGFDEFAFIAGGGLGEVWRARWVEKGVTVAVKVPRQVDDEFFARLEDEATALQELDHPNIVRLLDVRLTDEGRPCLVLEYIEGKNLAAGLPSEGYPVEVALRYFRQVLDAVEEAHRRGIIHRDLKPSNVLVDAGGTVKVADFGLAADIHQRSVRLALTESGAVAGTVEYLPPEAFRADTLADRRTDIYALGILLYELLTGEPPRGGWHDASAIRAGVDVRLDDVIRRAIHRDPARRYATVEAIRADLDRIRASRPRYAGSPRCTSACRLADAVWTLAGGFALLLSVSTAFHLDKSVTRLPLNLFGGHAHMICAWLTVKTLLLTCGGMAVWQIARLWRFRGVPMREALPSPFGLALGEGTTAMLLVWLAQLLLFVFPLVLAGFFFGGIEWRQADAATWSHVLAVTDYLSHPIGIWDWSANWDGKEAWLREVTMQPNGWYLNVQEPHDKVSFYPGFQPTLMAAGAALSAVALCATGVSALLSWWERRRRLLTVLAGIAVLAVAGGIYLARIEAERRKVVESQLYPNPDSFDRQRSFERFGIDFLARRDGSDLLDRQLDAYAPVVSLNGSRSDRATEVRQYLAEQDREKREKQRVWIATERQFAEHGERASLLYKREFFDTPNSESFGSCGGGIEELTLWGRLRPDGNWMIDEERLERVRIYTADSELPDTGGLETFVDASLACLAAPGCSGLERFIADPMFGQPAAKLLATLRAERLGWKTLEIGIIRMTEPALLPGRRFRVRFDAERSGLHAVLGHHAEEISWQFDVARISGEWRILRLSM